MRKARTLRFIPTAGAIFRAALHVADGSATGAAGAGSDAVQAPGERVLTLTPGGAFDFASGSSIAAAQVSGVLALMRALDPTLTGERARALLAGSGPVDACRAVQALRPQQPLQCQAAPQVPMQPVGAAAVLTR